MADLWRAFTRDLNFFRLHLLFFAFTPLIASAFFYGANGRYPVQYIDALFTCVSAISTCGLVSINFSPLTGFQQAIVFVLSVLGSPVFVSWVTVYIRRRYVNKHIAAAKTAERSTSTLKVSAQPGWASRLSTAFQSGAHTLSPVPEVAGVDEEVGAASQEKEKTRKYGSGGRVLGIDMIRRVDTKPVPVDTNGWVMEKRSGSSSDGVLTDDSGEPSSDMKESVNGNEAQGSEPELRVPILDEGKDTLNAIPSHSQINRSGSISGGAPLKRSTTVEFQIPERDERIGRTSVVPRQSMVGSMHFRRNTHQSGAIRDSSNSQDGSSTSPLVERPSALQSGLGGFPYPHQLLSRAVSKIFPNLSRRFERTMTIPQSTTISSMRGSLVETRRSIHYITFDATIGRNSQFLNLTDDNRKELGGVEYRALDALLWMIPLYYLCSHLICFAVVAPYMSLSRWRGDFEPPKQARAINPVWFSAFQVVASFSNTGMSLVDQSMIPFQRAYPMILAMTYLVLAGQTGFPIFLRFMIWILTKLVPFESRLNQTLHFLLDHPRRCFLYLFPSHQTWFLFSVVCMLTATDWFFFLVLDLGNASFLSIPAGVRVIIGLLQAVCVRAAGYATVPILQLVPAVQVLFVIMMYIAIYPITLSVRSTNVYEERSLGVYDHHGDDDFNPEGSRAAVWGKYLAWHARQQLAFALFLICIIERSKLEDVNNAQWFTIFSIIFEIVSAYGNVGLSLGVPYDNFSLSGAFSTLSKLILCAVMLRGRHRGLPSAIDRAIMLPSEFLRKSVDDGGDAEAEQQQKDKDKVAPPLDGIPVSSSSSNHHHHIGMMR